MRMFMQWNSNAAAALLATVLLAGCAGTATMNKPLSRAALNENNTAISKGGYRLFSLSDSGSPEVLVLLSFSGGGKRSAAFGYGVLHGLRDFPIAIEGRQQRLLDEIDIMASVSGGSFPAAYYGLYRDKIFTDFEKDFLNQNIESYVWGTYLIPWHLGWLVDPDYGTNDRMAEVYDELMFHGATYADLLRAGRPMLAIDATDVDHGLAFPFIAGPVRPDLFGSLLLSAGARGGGLKRISGRLHADHAEELSPAMRRPCAGLAACRHRRRSSRALPGRRNRATLSRCRPARVMSI